MNQNELAHRIDQNLPALLEQLAALVSIPSVSSDPEQGASMVASADLVAAQFAELGFDVKVTSSVADSGIVGKPAVLAERRVPNPEAPTILLYAHHDVQPVGDESTWSYPPFELTVENGRAYGRGSADDGAGIVVHLGALAALGDQLAVNVVVFIEGEEEIGSPSFKEFLREHEAELAADVIIVADSSNWTEDVPALTDTLRGVVDVDVNLRVLDHAVHSGMFGGPILDAVTLSSRLIATLHDEQGDVAVPGLGGEQSAQVDWNEEDFRRDASVVDGYELAGTGDLAARVWTKPALAVIGFDARPTAEASNTIAAECSFRLSLRTAPDSDPQEAQRALVRYLEDNVPFGAQVTVTPGEVGPGFQADSDGTASRQMREALAAAWGHDAVTIGIGGSIPFIADFQCVFPEAQILVTGVEDPRSNAHSENESVAVSTLRNAALAEALFLQGLAK